MYNVKESRDVVLYIFPATLRVEIEELIKMTFFLKTFFLEGCVLNGGILPQYTSN